MTENLKLSRQQLEATVETLKTTQAQLIQSEKLSGIGTGFSNTSIRPAMA